MEANLIVAWNVRRLRVEKNISQDDLGLAAGIERAYIGYLERGKRNPTVSTLEKIQQALNCELTDLFIVPDQEDLKELKQLKPGRRKVT